MRSNHVLGVTAIAVSLGISSFGICSLGICSLGIGSALAATPASNFQAHSSAKIKSFSQLFPAQAGVPGLSRIANSENTATPRNLALSAASAQTNVSAHVAQMHIAALAARFAPSHGAASSSHAALNELRQMPAQSKGLAGFKNAAGPGQAGAPALHGMAAAAAKPRPTGSLALLSSLPSH